MTKMYNRKPAAEARHEVDRAKVLATLDGESMTLRELAQVIGRSSDYMKLLVFDMEQCGDIVKTGRGIYHLPD